MSGPNVVPSPVGTVADLGGVRLRASAELLDGALSIRSFDIDIARRATPGVSVFHHHGGEVAPHRLRFATLDGRPAHRGMTVDHRRPTVRLECQVPVVSYSWRMTQNGRLLEEVKDSDAGISADGRCITFTPTEPLLRKGRLPNGYFFPPFAVFKEAPRGYHGITYGANVEGPDPHSPFAIDFNRGNGDADKGDPVLAVQAGRVIHIDRSEDGHGTVWIRHRGDYMTQYTHMTDIPERFGDDGEFTGPDGDRPGALVGLLEEVGKIGKVGAKAFHLHHRHHRHKVDGEWQPIQMAFGREAYELSQELPAPGTTPKSRTNVRGWTKDKAATLVVTARLEDGSSVRRPLRFRVGPLGSVPPGDDPGCGATPFRVRLELVYAGPALAAGEYVVRYQATDDQGHTGSVAIDESLVIAP
jgi:hypothetical protein